MSRPEDVVWKGLEDRDWDCMCDPGPHEDPCPFAALTALTDELAAERAKTAGMFERLLAADDELAAKDRALREIAERTHHARDDSHTAYIARRCREALSPSPPEQEKP